MAGLSDVESGGKLPCVSAELGPILDAHGLRLVSGRYPGTVLDADLEAEKVRVAGQLRMLRELDVPVLVDGNTAGTIRNRH